MTNKNHALLSPSSSKMWLECTPSVRLGESIASEESVYATEGSEAHELCEHKLKTVLGMYSEDPTNYLQFYNNEMEACAVDYASYVYGIYCKEKETDCVTAALVEERINASDYAPNCFGTADSLIIGNHHLYVTDFKYGMGIPVFAENNTQLLIYALGTLDAYDKIFDIRDVTLTIFQPRLNNISTCEISSDDIYHWGKNYLKPRAELAYNGEGELKSGPWCQFCKVKASCRKRAEENLKLAQHEFKNPELLTDEELSDVLTKADELVEWAQDVKRLTISRLLGGKKISGFKLVEGRSIRRYKDESAAAEAVKNAGFNPFEEKILGIGAMENLLGKKQFNEILGDFVEKPHGKPVIVPSSDKRPEMITTDFNDLND